MDARTIEIKQDILSENARDGEALRFRLAERGVKMINLMASPGAGKTTTILATIKRLRDELGFAVVEGDIESQVDSKKVKDAGVPAVQINTGGACHLDIPMVEPALGLLDLDELDVVFVENIGNLVCPAEFDIGEALKVMILSVPEGDDKILKYPLMFSMCDVLIVNKCDFLELSTCDFNMDALLANMSRLNPKAKVFQISSLTGVGLDDWCDYLLGFARS